jgi:uncharacterized protein YndB with AHSA1/START domain
MSAPIIAPTEQALKLTRLFDAPRDLVWAAWTDVRHAAQWWGPRHHPSTHLEIDARVGGKWRICLESVEDGRELWHGGVFREVVKPERLVFTFAWDAGDGPTDENIVTITFAEEGENTRMEFRQEPFVSADERAGHTEGWSSTFDRLDDVLVAWKGQSR